MEDTQRLKTKMALAVALSNMGLLSKLPEGRVDELLNFPGSWPQALVAAVSDPRWAPLKGSRDWRVCRDYAVDLRLPEPRRARRSTGGQDRPPAPKVRAWVDSYGQCHFRARLVSQLKAAGRDYARDCREQLEGPEGGDIAGPAWDIAESMLASEGLDPGQRGFQALKECAGDYVAAGIQSVIG